MAEKEKKSTSEHGGKKKTLKSVTHHVVDKKHGGGFVHEHHYEGDPEPSFAGFSPTLDDVHQHIDDHMGAAQGGDDEQAEGEGGAAPPNATQGTQGA